ncbi:response regulator transcription factor [Actinoplanes sp. NPDC048796]|uniref:helix-turn-helix transcriptional regulator n=1 Tax=Actinoplanes sp. NPDC048796 TaxID=3155640 RepID=UPI0033C9FC43
METTALAPTTITPLAATPIAGLAPAAITVALRATDPLSLAGLSRLLGLVPGLHIVDGDGATADVLVFAAARVDGRVIPALRRSSVETRRPVVLIVEEITREELLAAVECRVVSVLPVAAVTTDRLSGSIHTAVGGGAVLPPGLAGDLMTHVRQLQSDVLDESGRAASGLRPREVEVIRLMAEGWETTEIGAHLNCSERTVKAVISGILRRLSLRNRSHIIAHAMRFGVI